LSIIPPKSTKGSYKWYYPQIIEHKKDHDHAVGNPNWFNDPGFHVTTGQLPVNLKSNQLSNRI